VLREQVLGCLLVDSKVLKSNLGPVILSTQQDVKHVLTTIARSECTKVLHMLTDRNTKLSERPSDLDGFMEYQLTHGDQFKQRQSALAAVERVRPSPTLPSTRLFVFMPPVLAWLRQYLSPHRWWPYQVKGARLRKVFCWIATQR
jgi:hypothetical protein